MDSRMSLMSAVSPLRTSLIALGQAVVDLAAPDAQVVELVADEGQLLRDAVVHLAAPAGRAPRRVTRAAHLLEEQGRLEPQGALRGLAPASPRTHLGAAKASSSNASRTSSPNGRLRRSCSGRTARALPWRRPCTSGLRRSTTGSRVVPGALQRAGLGQRRPPRHPLRCRARPPARARRRPAGRGPPSAAWRRPPAQPLEQRLRGAS